MVKGCGQCSGLRLLPDEPMYRVPSVNRDWRAVPAQFAPVSRATSAASSWRCRRRFAADTAECTHDHRPAGAGCGARRCWSPEAGIQRKLLAAQDLDRDEILPAARPARPRLPPNDERPVWMTGLDPLLSVSLPGLIRQSRHSSRRFSGLRWLEPSHPTTSPCAALTPADSPYLSRSSNEAERGALAAYLRLLELGGGNGPVESGA